MESIKNNANVNNLNVSTDTGSSIINFNSNKYILTKRNFTKKEKDALEDVRTNIIDLTIFSDDNFQLNESNFIEDIKKFLISNNFGIELFNYKFNNEDNISLEDDGIEISDTMKNAIIKHMCHLEWKNYVKSTIKGTKNTHYGYKHLKSVIDNFDHEEIAIILDNYLNNLSHEIFQEITGLGDIDPLLADDELEEIMIIGINKPVFVYHRQNSMMETNLTFNDEEEVIFLIDAIARQINRRINKQSPILDSCLADGSRVNAILPPISPNDITLTIHKFKEDPLTIVDLIKSGTLKYKLSCLFMALY